MAWASAHLVKWSVNTRIQLFPLGVGGMDPTRSTATICQGRPAYSLQRPASPGRLPCLLAWQISHCLTLSRTPCPIPGQYHWNCSLVITLWTPAWACLWVSHINSWRMAVGQTTLFFSGCPSLTASVRVSHPSSPIRSESQHWQSIQNSTHPCLSCSSVGRRPSLFAQYTSATIPGRFSWSFCSSATLSANTALVQRLCTASVSSSTTGSSRLRYQSHRAVGLACVSKSYLEGPPSLLSIPRHCLHPSPAVGSVRLHCCVSYPVGVRP